MSRGGPGGPPASRHSAITKASVTEPMTCPESGGRQGQPRRQQESKAMIHDFERLTGGAFALVQSAEGLDKFERRKAGLRDAHAYRSAAAGKGEEPSRRQKAELQ